VEKVYREDMMKKKGMEQEYWEQEPLHHFI